MDLLNKAGRFDRAEELIQESLAIRREVLPGDDAGIAASLSLLGECLAGQGRREEAEQLLRSSYRTIREARSPGNPELVAALSRLVRVYAGWQEEEQARIHRRALAQALTSSPFKRTWPAPRLVFGLEQATLFEALDRLVESHVERIPSQAVLQERWHDVVAERERSLPADHPLALLCAQYLGQFGGDLHDAGGDVAVCEAIFREALAIQEEHPLQPLNDWRFGTLWWLAWICEQDGRFQEGERLARDTLSAARDLDAGEGWRSASAESVLGACLIGQARYAEAEPLVLRGALTGLKLRTILKDDVLRACYRVRDLYALWGDPRNAEAVWRGILCETADRGLHGEFIDETVQSVATTQGLEVGTYDLARDYVKRRLAGPRSDEEQRRLHTQLFLTHLRTGAYEEGRSIFPELEARSGGATAIEWSAYAMVLGALGETDEAARALELARDLLAEDGVDAAAARWVAEAEAALR